MRRTLFFGTILSLGIGMLLFYLNGIIDTRITSIKDSTYTRIADEIKKSAASHIEDKRNTTFAIALGLSDNPIIIDALKTGSTPHHLQPFIQKLKTHSQYKTVWIQLVDNKGTSLFRTWTDNYGDSLIDKRKDVAEMIADPRIMNTISVGIFSMTFKSLVPVFDHKKRFLGSLEVIAHFDTVTDHLTEEELKPVLLVDKAYRSQITKPLSKSFIGEYYLVNGNADPALLELIQKEGVTGFTAITDYRLVNDQFVTLLPLMNVNNEPMAYFLLFKPLKSIDFSQLTSFEHAVKLAVPMAIFLLLGAIFLTIAIRRTKEAKRTAEELETKVRLRTSELQVLNEELEQRVAEGIEKQRHQEQQLIQQEKLHAMSSMLTNISHHWRQPLNVLALNIQDIAEAKEFGELTDEFIQKNISHSMEQIRYMSNTIDNFSNFFKEDVSDEPFSILESIKEVYSLLYPELKDAHIRFILPNQDTRVKGNRSNFRQILLNIINNAVEAIIRTNPEKGEIAIQIDEEAAHVTITISDNGGGIENAIMDKVFEPYFTTKFKSKGVGISLYMSKVIVENNMNGTLSVTNTPEGARFTIRIPKGY